VNYLPGLASNRNPPDLYHHPRPAFDVLQYAQISVVIKNELF
jgi:hypothetical protein